MEERSINANKIIQNHLVWSMGAGLIPLPIADFFAVSAIQLDMVRQLCKLYDIDFKETESKAVISSLTSSLVAKMGTRAALKLIPGIGPVLGGATMAVLSGASTFAVGQAFKKHFETGGTFLDFDLNRLKKVYDEMFEKGKEVATDIKQGQEEKEKSVQSEYMIKRLQDLATLRDSGVISDEEFEKLKSKLMG